MQLISAGPWRDRGSPRQFRFPSWCPGDTATALLQQLHQWSRSINARLGRSSGTGCAVFSSTTCSSCGQVCTGLLPMRTVSLTAHCMGSTQIYAGDGSLRSGEEKLPNHLTGHWGTQRRKDKQIPLGDHLPGRWTPSHCSGQRTICSGHHQALATWLPTNGNHPIIAAAFRANSCSPSRSLASCPTGHKAAERAASWQSHVGTGPQELCAVPGNIVAPGTAQRFLRNRHPSEEMTFPSCGHLSPHSLFLSVWRFQI